MIERIGFRGGQTDAYRRSLKQLRVHEDHIRQRKHEMMMLGVGKPQAVHASTANLDLGELNYQRRQMQHQSMYLGGPGGEILRQTKSIIDP